MTVIIELSEEKAALLSAKAQAQGVPVEECARQVLEQNLEAPPRRHIAEVIAENMRDVPREAFDGIPKDWATQLDHYVYGIPKRDE